MLAITLLLLVVGALLAAFGVLGFFGNWSSGADHDSLRFVQALATTGRRMTGAGLALHIAASGLPAGALLTLLLAAALLAGATYLTKTSNQIVPTGAAS